MRGDRKRTEFNWTDVAPSRVVIELIADESGRDLTEVEPLDESVDPDAIDQLICGNGANPHDHTLTV